MEKYPLKFKPFFIEKIWGGDTLSKLFPQKAVPEEIPVGESWELSVRDDYDSVVANGPYAGESLKGLISRFSTELLGDNGYNGTAGSFPLLYKFLDAHKTLSVQVHPDDDFAMKNEGDLGKMECWYIISARPGSRVYKGVKEGCGRGDFERLLQKNRVEECLNSFEVKKGDVIFLPSRTLHAIGEGLVLYEIQQNSDVTYRAYDWGRMGKNGKPRPLHVDKVLTVTDFNPPERNIEEVPHPEGPFSRQKIIECTYFVLEQIVCSRGFKGITPDDRFMVLTIVDGEGTIRAGIDECFSGGDTMLLPAGVSFEMVPDAPSTILCSYVPPFSDWCKAGS